jgi:hypothetical protein
MFLVSWKGVWQDGPKKGQKYDESDSTWQSRSSLKNAGFLVGMFEHPDKYLSVPRGQVIHGFGRGSKKNTCQKV